MIVSNDEGQFSLTKCSDLSDVPVSELGSTAVISEESADLLKKAGEGTLGNKLVNKNVDKVEKVEVKSDVVVGNSNGEKYGAGSVNIDFGDKNVKSVENTADTVHAVSSKSPAEETVSESKDNVDANVDGTNSEVVLKNDTENEAQETKVRPKLSSDSDNEEFVEAPSDFPQNNEATEDKNIKNNDSQEKGENDLTEKKEMGETIDENAESEVGMNAACEVVVSVDESAVKDESENLDETFEMSEREMLDEKRMSLGSELRRTLRGRSNTSESCISMESDVTYHSESEILDSGYDLEDFQVKPGEGTAASEDSNIEMMACGRTEKKPSPDIDTDALKHCLDKADESKESPTNISDSEELDTSVLMKYVDGADKTKIEAQERAKLFKQENVEDDVFMSMKQSITESSDVEASMQQFACNYVKDVVMDAVLKYNEELKNEQVQVRKRSAKSEDGIIDIIVPKRQYSEEILDKAGPFFSRSLSAGHIQVLKSGKIASSKHENTPVDFLSYQVEGDADVVLTSIEEEQKLEDGCSDQTEKLLQPVSGYGICYTTSGTHSALNSDESDTEEVDPDMADMLAQNNMEGFSPGLNVDITPEFTAMPVTLDNSKENKEGKNSEKINEEQMENEHHQPDSERDKTTTPKLETDSSNKHESKEKEVNQSEEHAKKDELKQENDDGNETEIKEKQESESGQHADAKADIAENAGTGTVISSDKKTDNCENVVTDIVNNVDQKADPGACVEKDNVKIEESVSSSKDKKETEVAETVKRRAESDSQVDEKDRKLSESGAAGGGKNVRISAELPSSEGSESGQLSESGSSGKKKSSKKKNSKKNSKEKEKEECVVS